MNIETLAEQWLVAKQKEQEANEERLSIEAQILKLVPAKEEGSTTTVLSNGLKLKSTGKLTYKVDVNMLNTLVFGWPEDARPLKSKLIADELILRIMRAERPDLWKKVAPAIKLTPAKTSIQIEGAN